MSSELLKKCLQELIEEMENPKDVTDRQRPAMIVRGLQTALNLVESMEPPPYQIGWLCPACGRGNAPWSGICTCAGRVVTVASTGRKP
jgi:hypothetical protein